MRFKEIYYFVFGFCIGLAVILVPFYFHNERQREKRRQNFNRSNLPEAIIREHVSHTKYTETLSNILYNKVKVLCMVMTHPGNHKTKAIHVKNTWGKRCNKLLFMTSEDDPLLETAIVLPIEESREALWNKTKASFQYVYSHYLDDYDYFLKADDDK